MTEETKKGGKVTNRQTARGDYTIGDHRKTWLKDEADRMNLPGGASELLRQLIDREMKKSSNKPKSKTDTPPS